MLHLVEVHVIQYFTTVTIAMRGAFNFLQSKPLQSVISMYNTVSLKICLIYMHLPEGHTYKSGKSLTAVL